MNQDQEIFNNAFKKVGDLLAEKNTKIESQALRIKDLENCLLELIPVVDATLLTDDQDQAAQRARRLLIESRIIEPDIDAKIAADEKAGDVCVICTRPMDGDEMGPVCNTCQEWNPMTPYEDNPGSF